MFDFLNRNDEKKRKDELRENIDQIREQIEHRQDGAGSDVVEENSGTPGKRQRSRRGGKSRRRTMAQGDSGPGDRGPDGGPEGPSPDRRTQQDSSKQASESSAAAAARARRSQSSEDRAVRGQEAAEGHPTRPDMRPDAPENENDSEDRGGVAREDVPQPPEVKNLDIPDIEKGPLFITVAKFKEALGLLGELRSMSAELSENVDDLEQTLEDDRQTNEQLRGVLERANGDTKSMQDIVSP